MERKQDSDFRRYLRLLRDWAWLIILLPALTGTAAFLASRKQTPVYQAETTLLIIEPPGTTAVSDYQAILTSQQRTQTYSQLLTTRPLLQAVIQKMGLTMTPGTLRGKVNVISVVATQLIRLQVNDTDPHRATNIANTLVSIFADQTQQLQTSRYTTPKDELKAQMTSLENQIRQMESQLTTLTNSPADRATRDRLETSLGQYRQVYTNLLQTYEQVHLTEAQSTSNVVQVEPAVVPGNPIAPQVFLNTIQAVIVGLLLALGFVFIRDSLDVTIRDPQALANQTGLPILGFIAPMAKSETAKLLVVDQPQSAEAEAFRALRTNLRFGDGEHRLRTILITSPSANEGKSGVAANLAVVLAQQERRVILVDADLRRPMLHNKLNIPNRAGLSDLLRDPHRELDGIVRETGIPNLSIITSGSLPKNPAEMIGSEAMPTILNRLQEQADVVLVDAPPVTVVSDASILAPTMDGVLLVVKDHVTKIAACKQTIAQLQHVAATVIGLVVTDIPATRSGYGYGSYDQTNLDQGGGTPGASTRSASWWRRKTQPAP